MQKECLNAIKHVGFVTTDENLENCGLYQRNYPKW